MPAPGDTLYLALQLADGNTAKFPVAHIFNDAGVEVSGSPVNLTHKTSGLYTANGPAMPVGNAARVQYLCYDDSGHTTLSLDEGVALDVLMSTAPTSTNMALALQLSDGATGKFPLARLFDNTGTELVGSPVALTEVSNGLYIGSLAFPNAALEVIAQYLCYDNSLHTVLTDSESIASDFFFPGMAVSSDPGVANVRQGTSYQIGGATRVGTLVIPTNGQVLKGVQFDGARFGVLDPGASKDPGTTNVRDGVVYQINDETLVGELGRIKPYG